MSADQRIATERVDYAGRTYRIRSEARPDRAEIATTLEHGEAVLMAKTAPYDAGLDADAVDRALGGENRSVRERLLAGDLDAWLEPVTAPAELVKRPPLRRPGRWAVKVGMVEKPFRAEKPAAPPAEAAAWEVAPASVVRSVPPPKAPAPPPPASVRHLGPYVLVEPLPGDRFLAVGGGGSAQRVVLLRTFEVPSPQLATDARALLRVEHAAIVPLLEVGVAGETLFVASVLAEGRDAGALLRRAAELGRPLPVDVVAWIVREIARALEVFHAATRIHGAIAPEAISVGWGGEVRLAGLADALGRKPRPTESDDVAALGALLLALLGRGPADGASGARAPFVPPALLQIAQRTGRDGAGHTPLRSAQAVDAALSTYLAHDAPRTDAPRVARILSDLFPDGAQQDATRRAELIERARRAPRPPAEPLPPAAEPPTTPPVASASPQANDVERPPGSIVDGRYRIKRLCGRGGMGWVYEAEHEGIGRRVALKILHPFYSRSRDISERFRREARAASKIGHPHIADVFDFGTTDDGCLYIAMEFLEGRDLGQLLDEDGSVTVDRALRIIEQVCRALEAAHAAGVVHRDLKPENVFLLTRPAPDFVKVLDFGIAKYVEEPKEEKLTRPNIALGTPEYMAPEQVSGKVEPRSDIYAVGCMLYELLVGTPPFEGENYLEVFRRKALEDPPAPSAHRADVAPELDSLVMRTLARKPDGRPPSMAALADEIAALLRAPR